MAIFRKTVVTLLALTLPAIAGCLVDRDEDRDRGPAYRDRDYHERNFQDRDDRRDRDGDRDRGYHSMSQLPAKDVA